MVFFSFGIPAINARSKLRIIHFASGHHEIAFRVVSKARRGIRIVDARARAVFHPILVIGMVPYSDDGVAPSPTKKR